MEARGIPENKKPTAGAGKLEGRKQNRSRSLKVRRPKTGTRTRAEAVKLEDRNQNQSRNWKVRRLELEPEQKL